MWYVNTCFQLRTHKNTSSQPGSVISNVNHNLKNLHKQNKKHIPERVFMFLISNIQNMSIDLQNTTYLALCLRPPPSKCCCAFHVSEGGQKQETLLVTTYCDTKKTILYLKLYVLVYTLWIKQNEGGHSHQFSETLDTHTVLTKANSGIIWDL